LIPYDARSGPRLRRTMTASSSSRPESPGGPLRHGGAQAGDGHPAELASGLDRQRVQEWNRVRLWYRVVSTARPAAEMLFVVAERLFEGREDLLGAWEASAKEGAK